MEVGLKFPPSIKWLKFAKALLGRLCSHKSLLFYSQVFSQWVDAIAENNFEYFSKEVQPYKIITTCNIFSFDTRFSSYQPLLFHLTVSS